MHIALALRNVWLKEEGTLTNYNYHADFSMRRQDMVLQQSIIVFAREEACTNTGAVDSRGMTVPGLFRMLTQMNKLYQLVQRDSLQRVSFQFSIVLNTSVLHFPRNLSYNFVSYSFLFESNSHFRSKIVSHPSKVAKVDSTTVEWRLLEPWYRTCMKFSYNARTTYIF